MLGPDRSCAEWLLRNGAFIKWVGSKKFLTDYNSLPGADNKGDYFIEEIYVDEAGIMQVGFRHFGEFFSLHLMKFGVKIFLKL